MVGKTSRCFALACLLAFTLLLPSASLHAGESRAPAERTPALWSPLESLWQIIVRAACVISSDGSCPGPVVESGCDRGPLIDPNGGCVH
jgi:hypothetical protein